MAWSGSHRKSLPASAPALHALFLRAEFPPDLIQLLPPAREWGGGAGRGGRRSHRLHRLGRDGAKNWRQSFGERLVSSTLELSGCDAIFVLPDADIEMAAKAAWFGMTTNNGQTCIAVRRAFVPLEVYPAFVESLQKQVAVAGPMRLAMEGQVKQADRLVADAEQQGGRVLRPAAPPPSDPQTTVPRIVVDGTPSMALAREDCFAPLLAVLPVRDAEDALAQAEKCEYGLGASVFYRAPVAGDRIRGPYPLGHGDG